MKILFLILVFSVFFLSSCSVARFARYYASADAPGGKLEEQVYKSKGTSYEIGKLGGTWKKIDVKGGDIAFLNGEIGATITADSTCDKKGRYSLTALSESLTIGIEDKELIGRNELMIDGQKALSSFYTGKLDGVSLKLNAVVFRKGGCIYDFTYVSSPDEFDAGLGEFQKFTFGFRIIK